MNLSEDGEIILDQKRWEIAYKKATALRNRENRKAQGIFDQILHKPHDGQNRDNHKEHDTTSV